MPKKKKSKALKETQESAVVDKVKSSTILKNTGKEIDEIFSGKKRKKPEDKNDAGKPKFTKKKKKSKEDTEGRFIEPGSKPRRKTADGFTIYTEKELGISSSNAGGTPLCPFDCDCCF